MTSWARAQAFYGTSFGSSLGWAELKLKYKFMSSSSNTALILPFFSFLNMLQHGLIFNMLYAETIGLGERPWKVSDARLVLEDGSIWKAKSFGATGTQVGEVVFNTSLTGWDEELCALPPAPYPQKNCFSFFFSLPAVYSVYCRLI